MKNKIFNKKLIIILLFFSFKMYSCSCINKPTVKEAVISSDYIFIGKVKKIDIVKIEGLDFLKVLFEVKSYFKGRVKKCFTIYTAIEEELCGFPFKLKNSYIVYANLYKNKYVTKFKKLKKLVETDICTRTKEYDSNEIIDLNKYKKEKPIKKKKKNRNNKAITNKKYAIIYTNTDN